MRRGHEVPFLRQALDILNASVGRLCFKQEGVSARRRRVSAP